MSKIKNAMHDELTDAADTEALRENGYSEAEIARMREGDCRNCAGGGWVCENHQDRPWDGTSAHSGACGCGAGAPCPVCQREMTCAPFTVENGHGWRPMSEPLPRDATILVTVEPTEQNSTFLHHPPGTLPAYVDELGRLCDCGTWKPDKGLRGEYWRTVAWMPLPRAASLRALAQTGETGS